MAELYSRGMFNFFQTAKLFYRVIVPFDIPPNSV